MFLLGFSCVRASSILILCNCHHLYDSVGDLMTFLSGAIVRVANGCSLVERGLIKYLRPVTKQGKKIRTG